MTSDPSSPNQPNTELHFLVAALLILGAVGAGTLGGYLVGQPGSTTFSGGFCTLSRR